MLTANLTEKAFKELREETNDRAVAIVGATLLEGQLEQAIMRRLHPMSNNHRDALFRDEYGHTFSSKIDLGLSLGLYGQKVKTDLHRIKKIRNEFAHNLDRDFGSPDIVKICSALTKYEEGKPFSEEELKEAGKLRSYLESREWRWRFLFAITHIGNGLLREALTWVKPPEPSFLKD